MALLKLTIENITQLMMPLPELQNSPQQLAIFKLVQVFTRLNVAYKAWQERGPHMENNQVRRFILEGFKGLPSHSGVATAQILAVSKRDDPKGLESLLYNSYKPFTQNHNANDYYKKPFTQNYTPKNFGRGRGTRAIHNPGRGGPQRNLEGVICYSCGKRGHTKKACRLNKQHQNKNKPIVDNQPAN